MRAPATTANSDPASTSPARARYGTSSELGEPNGTLDASHLGVRAFARYAKPSEWSFTFTDRICAELARARARP